MNDYQVGDRFRWRLNLEKLNLEKYSRIECVIVKNRQFRMVNYMLHRTRADGTIEKPQEASCAAAQFADYWEMLTPAKPTVITMTGGLDYLSAINDCQAA